MAASFQIPLLNLELREVKDIVWDKIKEPVNQRRLILVIVSIALLLDNMLYMVIVPIIPDYLREIGGFDDGTPAPLLRDNRTGKIIPFHHDHHGQDSATGLLFASKAIVQLMVNPFSGGLIDKIGYDIPMMIGLTIMFFSTAVFACGSSYSVLFFARSLQGAGSAFADTAGLAMIADRFTEENERSQALGIALAFISFGCLVAPPFGGALYQFAGKEVPFLILALVCLIDGLMLLLVMKPVKETLRQSKEVHAETIPIWRLLMDPYIAVCAGALTMSNVALAFLEPTISLWMEDNLTTDNWKIGMVWLPAFFPHVLGVIITVKMAKKYPQHQWLMAAGGLALEGLSCFVIPFSSSYKMLMIPICVICFGIALIDTALLPTLGYLVDVRYVSVYGSIYAIADISYSIAYAVGPIIAGGVVEAIGFTALNFLIAFSNLLYVPVLRKLRNIYDFKPFENEANILMQDPPNKEYQTYVMQDQQPVEGDLKNHLEYGKQYQQEQETNVDDQNYDYQSQGGGGGGYQQQGSGGSYQQNQQYQQQQQQQYQPGYQEQGGGGYQQETRHLPQQRVANPFQQQQPQIGWKDSLLSLPKKWLSTTDSVDEFGFPDTLPKVPVPPLEDTMANYVRTLETITTPVQLERTKSLIKQFTASNGMGPKLHQYLLDKREVEDNWAYNYWLNDMYMDIRIPLPINSNPGMVLPPRHFTTVHDVARFSGRILEGIMNFKETLDSGNLPQKRAASREKNQPLCMAQNFRLLGSCRRPGIERDSQFYPQHKSEDEHVIVMCRNQMYCVILKASDRGKLSDSEIASQILYVLSDAPCLPAKPAPIGLLTAEPRTRWAQDRAVLQRREVNRRNIELIETALIVLCLDEPLALTFNACGFNGATPPEHSAGNRDETNMAHEMIHGGGSEYNSANRWFDKTMQVIICTDGTWGLCYEHSSSEGGSVVALLEDIYQNILDHPSDDNGVPQHHLPPPERLEWEAGDDDIKHRFAQASKTVDKAIDDLDFYVHRYKGYGKNFIKTCRCSPDVYIQLCLQLAYYKLYGHLVATYESASTTRFLLGRVDCIRANNLEVLEWAKAMCQDEGANIPFESDRDDEEDSRKVKFSIYSKDHLRELFRCAVARQTEVMVKNILGSGIDIPMLGLREASREVNGQLHELFTDESYNISNCFLLSTSQVATNSDSFMGYGPVTPRGYGCSYNPHPEEIVFCVSAFYSCEDTSASRYAKSLQDSLDIMRNLLEM